MRIVIIEDEPLTSDTLASMLRELDGEMVIVRQLYSVEEACVFFESYTETIDLIFSDIQLSDGTSFDIFKRCNPDIPVIFCTAYDQFAIQAFQTKGIDYLLKPFALQHVAQSLGRYEQLKKRFAGNVEISQELYASLLNLKPVTNDTGFLVYKGNEIIPLKMRDVAIFFILNELTYLITLDARQFKIDRTLEEIQQQSGSGFFRANRQSLVNRKAIAQVKQDVFRKMSVTLIVEVETSITVSKARAPLFLKWLADN